MHRERLLRIMRWMQEARDIRKTGAWKQRLTNPDHGSGIWPRWSELHRNSSISGGFEMNLVLQTSNIPRNLSEIRPKFVHFSWDWIFFPIESQNLDPDDICKTHIYLQGSTEAYIPGVWLRVLFSNIATPITPGPGNMLPPHTDLSQCHHGCNSGPLLIFVTSSGYMSTTQTLHPSANTTPSPNVTDYLG